MSTPTFNTVPTTAFVPAAGNDGALQYGVKWGGAYGTGVTLTYSFPNGNVLGSSTPMAMANSTTGIR